MSSPLTEKEERRAADRVMSERILVCAPSGDDGVMIAEVLGREGHESVLLDDLSGLVREWERGACALLIATEALDDPNGCTALRELLEAQESWSEIPIVLLGGGAEDEGARVTQVLGSRAHLLILERPLGIPTLVSAVDSGLRSRRRQYEVKHLLDEVAASAAAVSRAYEQADRVKDEFLATLAHELRSPLTAIRGWVQMLKLGDLSQADATEALSMIEASTKVQGHIIEDLMDVARILSGKIMIEPAVIPLAPVVSNIVATFRPAATLSGIDLTATIAEEPILVNADDVRLQQVGWNILSNAIKFTQRGGSVNVSLTREPRNAVLRIRDTGEGISPELLPHVFDRYRQQEGSGGKHRQGLGLGLAIVRHLVESHGGTILALSEGRGKGSEFVVTLPLHEA